VTAVHADTSVVLDGLRSGDEVPFATIVSSWSPTMLQVARRYVSTSQSAEDVVQETWLAVIEGLDRFESRSTLRTWVYGILLNTARSRGVRESRTSPLHSATDRDLVHDGEETPETVAIAGDTRRHITACVARLGEPQRSVMVLRDLAGLTAAETCSRLGLSAANQRVLLHRARAQVRRLLGEDVHADAEGRRRQSSPE
jgi:RNA polymerase sigma-70 factor, ECF subfamily